MPLDFSLLPDKKQIDAPSNINKLNFDLLPDKPEKIGNPIDESMVKPAKSVYGGILKASANFADTLDFYAKKLTNKIVGSGVSLSKYPGDTSQQSDPTIYAYLRDNWDKYGDQLINEGPTNKFTKAFYRGLGGAAFDVPVKYLGPGKFLRAATLPVWGGVEGYKSGGVGGAAMGAVSGALTHGAIKGIGLLPATIKYPTAFAFGYGSDLSDRPLEDKIADGLIWTGLSLGRSPSMSDFVKTQKDFGVQKDIQRGRNTLATRIIDTLIKPREKDVLFGKNPSFEIARSRITGNNFQELEKNISQEEIKNRVELNKRLVGSESKIELNANELVGPLNNLKKTLTEAPGTHKALITRVNNAITDILNVKDEEGNVVGKRNISDLTPVEVVELKRTVGGMQKWSEESYTDDNLLNKKLKSVYHYLDNKVDKAVPGTGFLNEREANLISAVNLVRHRQALARKQDLIGFNAKTTGAIVGYMFAGHNPGSALGGYLTGVLLDKTMAHPAVKTRLAKWLIDSPKPQIEQVFKDNPQIYDAVEKQIINSNNQELRVKLLEYKPKEIRNDWAVLSKEYPPEYVNKVESNILTLSKQLPFLRMRGMKEEVASTERQLNDLLNVQKDIYQKSAEQNRLKTSSEIVQKKSNESGQLNIKIIGEVGKEIGKGINKSLEDIDRAIPTGEGKVEYKSEFGDKVARSEIDKELLPVLDLMNSNGIKTIESDIGHIGKDYTPYISVSKDSIPKVEKLLKSIKGKTQKEWELDGDTLQPKDSSLKSVIRKETTQKDYNIIVNDLKIIESKLPTPTGQKGSAFLKALIPAMAIGASSALSSANAQDDKIDDKTAIKVILGEAESESQKGQQMIGEVLRRRGSLQGIYGQNAIVEKGGKYYRINSKTHKEMPISDKIIEQVKQAWKDSESSNFSENARYWQSDVDLQKTHFDKNPHFKIIKKEGGHTFLKKK